MNQVVALTSYTVPLSGTNDRGPYALTVFETAGGAKFQTFDDALAAKGKSLIGQSASVEYEVESRPYTIKNGPNAGQQRTAENNVLKSISESTGAAEGPPQGAIRGSIVTLTNEGASVVHAPYTDDRELRIMRQSGLDRAISTAAAGIAPCETVNDLFALSDAYIGYFQNGIQEDQKF